MRFPLLTAITAALLLPAACTDAPPAAPRAAQTPPGAVLVVIANLKEAYGDRDWRDPREIRVFARRLVADVPYHPDVLLLQEVRRKGARATASELTRLLGDRYVVGVDPGNEASKPLSPTETLESEMAIVVNSATMRKVGRGGFVRTRYAYRHRAPGTSTVGVKRHPWMLVEEVRPAPGTMDRFRLPLTSVHLTYEESLAPGVVDFYYERWSRMLADNLRSRFPNPAYAHVLGGDFNGTRCLHEKETGCTPRAPFYRTLTGEPYKLTDALFAARGDSYSLGIDLIFTSGDVAEGTNEAGKDDRTTNTYSDHVFRWAIVRRQSATGG